MSDVPAKQTVVLEESGMRVVCVDSAYDVDGRNSARDIVVTGSYSGVLCARFVSVRNPCAALGVDCAIGPEGASIAGLWYYEALNLPAAAVDVTTVELGDGVDVYENGVISRLNEPARQCGVEGGMPVRKAVRLLLRNRPPAPVEPSSVTRRTAVVREEHGAIVCTDSIAFSLPEDRGRNVLCTGGHTGRSAVPYLQAARPRGFICSDGGRGRNDSGIRGLHAVQDDGLPGATVDARTARMGDGMSTYRDGVISAMNKLARDLGVRVGMDAKEAARLLLVGQNGAGVSPSVE